MFWRTHNSYLAEKEGNKLNFSRKHTRKLYPFHTKQIAFICEAFMYMFIFFVTFHSYIFSKTVYAIQKIYIYG